MATRLQRNDIMKNINEKDLKFIADTAWLGLDIEELFSLQGPLDKGIFEAEDEPPWRLIKTLCNPEYVQFLCEHILGITIMPYQAVVLQELLARQFPMLIGARGAGKSFMMALFAIVICIVQPGSKVIILGAGLRQSKIVFEYLKNIWDKAHILRDILGESGTPRAEQDRLSMRIGPSVIWGLPVGDGTKIRGFRATCLILDEFAALNPDIYMTVIEGFAGVSQEPMKNVQTIAAQKAMKQLGFMGADESIFRPKQNKSIITGTAYYTFNHFYDWWTKWTTILYSQGDPSKLESVYPEGIPEHFDWKSYSVIRLPVDFMPEGYMDRDVIAKAEASLHRGAFLNEYGAVFASDTAGFFRRSLIERCVAKKENGIYLGGPEPIEFTALTEGMPGREYVYGVDPASEVDNFCIVILELHGTHNRIVHCWTANKKAYKDLLRQKKTHEDDYYSFCVRRIRDLMRIFPCKRLGLDAQGGGIAIEEWLHNAKSIQEDELLVWPVIDFDDPKESDQEDGLHILDKVQFADANWTQEANHSLRNDLEGRTLLFPHFDSLSVQLATHRDELEGRVTNTLEDCLNEIEEMKDELSSITIQRTPTGKDRWDTPELKLPGGKKGRQRKDRYSALLIANMMAKAVNLIKPKPQMKTIGGWATKIKNGAVDGCPVVGPKWYTDQMKGIRYGQ